MSATEHLDVVIIGAGISGIGAAVELKCSLPGKTFVMLEMRTEIGGTWDLFRYPGVRSDSDMYTLGFGFKPWTEAKAIASGPAIKAYLRETMAEHGLERHLRLATRMRAASFDSRTNLWTLAVDTPQGPDTITCRNLYLGAGYYSYESGFNPELPGEHDFRGPIIHPQQWPQDLDYSGKRVAVIGSGATAITLVPSLADEAAKVTMVQRSPTYLATEDDLDEEADQLRKELGDEKAFARIRLRNLRNQQDKYELARRDPGRYKQELFSVIDGLVGKDMREKHFTPGYEPWDQRVCFVPNADLFRTIKSGKAEVVTGTIQSVTATGLAMTDGGSIDADIIVKATGLNLTVGGDAQFDVDRAPVDFSDCFTYKGVAYSDVPNLFFAFGFLNSSWTLRLELVNRFWVRVLERMDELNATRVTPILLPDEVDMASRPFIADVNSGYFQRSLARFPRQGDRAPWVNPQLYDATVDLLVEDPQDCHLLFAK